MRGVSPPMSVGAIVLITIAASGVLMMRFRKRWLAKINIAVTNQITSLFAGWLPGFGILTLVGHFLKSQTAWSDLPHAREPLLNFRSRL